MNRDRIFSMGERVKGVLAGLACILAAGVATDMGASADPAEAAVKTAAANAFPVPPEGTYKYTVRHSKVGNVGTFTNTIRRDGDDTIVETDVDISARVLFFKVADESAERRQVWRDGKLVSFESMTRDDGEDVVARGWAEGDVFIAEGPEGRIEAPADVFTTNPWNMRIVETTSLIADKKATLHEVAVVKEKTDVIKVNGEKIETRYFKIEGHRDEELWYDERGVPVRFALRHSGGRVTFTLDP